MGNFLWYMIIITPIILIIGIFMITVKSKKTMIIKCGVFGFIIGFIITWFDYDFFLNPAGPVASIDSFFQNLLGIRLPLITILVGVFIGLLIGALIDKHRIEARK